MEARGLCRRVRSESDRRVVHIELTDEGKTAAEQMSGTLCRIYNAVLANFTPGEWTQLRALLARVADQAEGLHGRGVAAWGAPS
jgi:DNA-binding MarR family transcriptional regulator